MKKSYDLVELKNDKHGDKSLMRWTSEDTDYLIKMYLKGTSLGWIARNLKRSKKACLARLSRLDYYKYSTKNRQWFEIK